MNKLLLRFPTLLLMGVLLAGLTGGGCAARHHFPAPKSPPPARPAAAPPAQARVLSRRGIVLSFAGDCTFGAVNGDSGGARFPAIYRKSRQRDYPFHRVRAWLRADDLSVVNFECTLTNATRAADKQWHFKGDANYAAIFPAGSVEAVGLSNNHSHDYLAAGFRDTAASFRRAHVPVFCQNTPYVTNIKGIQVVLIGDCTVVGENTTQTAGVAESVRREIARYKKPGNLVIVVMHWGCELDTVPRAWQIAMGHRFIDAGADAVIGHHPHVVQGIECYRGKYIAYSLGNFAFGGNSRARFPETFVLRLHCRAENGEAGVRSLSIVPCLTTSSRQRSADGVLINDYQPMPVFGADAAHVIALTLARSRPLTYGIRTLSGETHAARKTLPLSAD